MVVLVVYKHYIQVFHFSYYYVLLDLIAPHLQFVYKHLYDGNIF